MLGGKFIISFTEISHANAGSFKAGANMIVSGTAIIQASNQRDVISLLRSSVESVLNK